MNADTIVKALRDIGAGMIEGDGSVGDAEDVIWPAADLIESLQAQLAESQRRERNARNELCLKCGRYHEAHNGSCDGCRWKEG